jgi:hypothetical protein
MHIVALHSCPQLTSLPSNKNARAGKTPRKCSPVCLPGAGNADRGQPRFSQTVRMPSVVKGHASTISGGLLQGIRQWTMCVYACMYCTTAQTYTRTDTSCHGEPARLSLQAISYCTCIRCTHNNAMTDRMRTVANKLPSGIKRACRIDSQPVMADGGGGVSVLYIQYTCSTYCRCRVSHHPTYNAHVANLTMDLDSWEYHGCGPQ